MNERTEEQTEFRDQTLTCCECGQGFLFSAGEVRFFKSKNLIWPKRCTECRQARSRFIDPNPGGKR